MEPTTKGWEETHLSPGLPLRSCPGYLPPHSRAPATSQGQVLGGQGGCRGCTQREWMTMVPWAPGKPDRTLHPALGWRLHMLSQSHHVWAPVLSVGPRGSLRPRRVTWAGPRCVRRHRSTSLCAAGPWVGAQGWRRKTLGLPQPGRQDLNREQEGLHPEPSETPFPPGQAPGWPLLATSREPGRAELPAQRRKSEAEAPLRKGSRQTYSRLTSSKRNWVLYVSVCPGRKNKCRGRPSCHAHVAITAWSPRTAAHRVN